MRIAFNPSTVAALIAPPNNKDITFDLRGQNVFARGVKFCGTDTWRPVVDNLTSDSTTSSLSANQGRILAELINGKSDSGHNHDDRYLRLTGGWMSGDIAFGGDNKIYWRRNTDSASISFKNDGDRDDDSYMSFVTSDNGNEYFRWSHSSGSTNTEWMALRSDGLRVGGTKVSLEGHSHNDLYYTKTEVNNKLNGKSDTSHNHDDRYLKLTGGTLTGDLYINTNLYGPAVGNNPRNRYDSGLYFFNCDSSTTSTYNFGLYQWNNEFQFTYRTSADNLFKGNSFTIQGSDGQVTFTKTPKVGSTLVSLNGHTHAYLPLSGGTMTGNIILKGGTSTDMTYAGNVHPYIRFDNSDSSQNVSLIFTDYDAYRSPAGIKLVGNQGNEWFEAANIYATNIQTSNIKNLSVGGGIYWNPYIESTTDGSDTASITLVKSGVAGGTTLVLSQMNEANDTIQFKTSTAAKLYHNSYPILTTQNTYVSNNKGYINGTEITQVNNADTVDGYHASSLWRSDGAAWNPGANVSLTASGNNQEWSFDIRRNGHTGCYWHVWDSDRSTMLKVNADNGKVYAPYNFVGNLEGNASTATNAYHLRINSANTWSTWYWAGQGGQPSWLWGSNDGTNMYVWNPSNFSVNYANYSEYSTRLDGGTIAGWGTLTSSNGFSGIAAYDWGNKGAFCWAGKSGQMYMQVNGWFYQNEGRYRVIDTSDFNWTNLPGKVVAGNEFNIVNAGFNGDMWFNYLPINDRSKTATINSYIFGNGHQGLASIQASGFIHSDHSINDAVLLAGGGYGRIFMMGTTGYYNNTSYALSFHKLSSLCNNLVWVDGCIWDSTSTSFYVSSDYYPYLYANSPSMRTIYRMDGNNMITVDGNGLVVISCSSYPRRIGFFYTGRA